MLVACALVALASFVCSGVGEHRAARVATILAAALLVATATLPRILAWLQWRIARAFYGGRR